MSATEQGLAVKALKVTASLVKLSICPCGFTVLKDEIQIGTEYELEPGVVTTGIMICGGCGERHKIGLVMVKGREGVNGGFLPRSIFGDFKLCP